MAHSRHAQCADECPLMGVKQTLPQHFIFCPFMSTRPRANPAGVAFTKLGPVHTPRALPWDYLLSSTQPRAPGVSNGSKACCQPTNGVGPTTSAMGLPRER